MTKEEFELKLQQFLNNQVYIMAYRFNYDSARIFNDELIDYIKQLQQERNQFKEYTNHNYGKAKKYKEVIDKLKEFIYFSDFGGYDILLKKELLDILKEV